MSDAKYDLNSVWYLKTVFLLLTEKERKKRSAVSTASTDQTNADSVQQWTTKPEFNAT